MAAKVFDADKIVSEFYAFWDPLHQNMVDLYRSVYDAQQQLLADMRANPPEQLVFRPPKTPKRKPKAKAAPRDSSRQQPAQTRQTRSAARASRSLKPQAVEVKETSSLASSESEEPEKENVAIQPDSGCRVVAKPPALVKKVPASVKAVAKCKTPLVTSSPRTPPQTRSQRKALDENFPSTLKATRFQSPAVRTPSTRARQLFSPYAKCSVQEKARAFEQNTPCTPLGEWDNSDRTPVAHCSVAQTLPGPCGTLAAPVTTPARRSGRLSTRRLSQKRAKLVQDVLSSSDTSSTDDEWKSSPTPRKVRAPSVSRPDSTLSVTKPGPSRNLMPSPLAHQSRLGASKGPTSASSHKRHHSGDPVLKQQRKEELLRLKAENVKLDREIRQQQAQMKRKMAEDRKRKQELKREEKERLKEQERLKGCAAFHQRKQTDRNLDVFSLAAAHKRRAEPHNVTKYGKKPCPSYKSHRGKGNEDSEAARLVFGQPNTSLVMKAKLNNSLQQRAMLNSMNESMRSQLSVAACSKAHEKVEDCDATFSTTNGDQDEKVVCKEPSLNVTVTLNDKEGGQVMNETFVAGAPACPQTPASNAVLGSGDSNSYDITPHHSELPPEPNREADNYDIEDLNSGDDTDDDERPRKVVPDWAKPSSMARLVEGQYHRMCDTSKLFGTIEQLRLEEFFPATKKRYKERTSSAIWEDSFVF